MGSLMGFTVMGIREPGNLERQIVGDLSEGGLKNPSDITASSGRTSWCDSLKRWVAVQVSSHMSGELLSRMHEVVWLLELELSKVVGCIAEDRLKGRLGQHRSTQGQSQG